MPRTYKRPMFQQRHYETIARLLSYRVVTHSDLFNRTELDEVIVHLSDMFAEDNPRFKPVKFRQAVYRDGMK